MEWMNINRLLKRVEEVNKKEERKKSKNWQEMYGRRNTGYMIMNWWGKWEDIKWYWDEYLDLIVIKENRNNGQIGIDGW